MGTCQGEILLEQVTQGSLPQTEGQDEGRSRGGSHPINCHQPPEDYTGLVQGRQ